MLLIAGAAGAEAMPLTPLLETDEEREARLARARIEHEAWKAEQDRREAEWEADRPAREERARVAAEKARIQAEADAQAKRESLARCGPVKRSHQRQVERGGWKSSRWTPKA